MVKGLPRFNPFGGILLGAAMVLASMIIPPGSLLAQDPSEKGLPFVTNFYPKDFQGSPQNWAIMEDNKGLIYFGNQGYLEQYNGVKWLKIPFPGSIMS